MNKLPLARQNNIVVQELGEEVLIYDLDTHKAYNLNGTSSIIYNACDGVTSFEELKRKHKFTDDLIYLALDQLREENLISEQQENYFGTLSRREAIRKVGLTTMIAIPVITSLVAPQAVDAQSSGVCTPVPAPSVTRAALISFVLMVSAAQAIVRP